jgi:WD40-like Beta Propeller Repeat
LKPRDLLTVIVIGAVVVIGGFAAADAIRGKPRTEAQPAATTPTIPVQTTPSRLPGPQPQPEAPPGWPEGVLEGTLTLADAQTCDLRQIGLAGGRERPLAKFTGCQIWAPPSGARIAYGLGPSSADGLQPFRIADLNQPNLDLGGYRALFGVIVWSLDGQRIAWCGRRRTGFDLEVGGPATRLPRCPVAYTRDDQVAYAVGNKVLVGDRTVFTADGGITYARFGSDGSLAVVVDGNRIERWDGSSLTTTTKLTSSFQGITPILRGDNCAALLPLSQVVQLIDLGCKPGLTNRSFPGRTAAWSPDGEWVATSNGVEVDFHRVVGERREITWPVGAEALTWRPE